MNITTLYFTALDTSNESCHTSRLHVGLSFIYGITFLVTLIPNGSFFLVIIHDKTMRLNALNWLLLNMSFCDAPPLLFLSIRSLVYISKGTHDNPVAVGLYFTFIFVEVASLFLITIKRYQLVVAKVEMINCPYRMGRIILAMWIAFSILAVLYVEVFAIRSAVFLIAMLFGIVLASISLLLSVLTYLNLDRKSLINGITIPRSVSQARKRSAVAILIIGVSAVILYIPMITYQLLRGHFMPENICDHWNWIFVAARLIASGHCFMNVAALYWSSSKFLAGYNRLFHLIHYCLKNNGIYDSSSVLSATSVSGDLERRY